MVEIKFYMLILLYFLFVYIMDIRKNPSKFLSWIILILIQSLSLYYSTSIFQIIRENIFFIYIEDEIAYAIVLILLILANILIIVMINLILYKRNIKRMEYINNPINIKKSDINLNKKKENNSVKNNTSNKSNNEIEHFYFDGKDFETDINDDDDNLFESIQEMIKRGDEEEAKKYLRMVACFSKNNETVCRAQDILNNL